MHGEKPPSGLLHFNLQVAAVPVHDRLPTSVPDSNASVGTPGSTPAQGIVASEQHRQPAPAGAGQSQARAGAAHLGSGITDATTRR